MKKLFGSILGVALLCGIAYATNVVINYIGPTAVSPAVPTTYCKVGAPFHVAASATNVRNGVQVSTSGLLFGHVTHPAQPMASLAANEPAFVQHKMTPTSVGANVFTMQFIEQGFGFSKIQGFAVTAGPSGACAGSVESVSDSCESETRNILIQGQPATGKVLPTAFVTGCPTPGGTITLHLINAPGGVPAVLFVGTTVVDQFATPSCRMKVGNVLSADSFTMPGSGPTDGYVAINAGPIPPGESGEYVIQAFFVDTNAPDGASSTNAVKVDVN